MARTKGLPEEHTLKQHKRMYPDTIKHCENKECEQAWEDYNDRANADEIVRCDSMCGAPDKPETAQQYRNAYIHWREHSVTSGCSHGS